MKLVGTVRTNLGDAVDAYATRCIRVMGRQ